VRQLDEIPWSVVGFDKFLSLQMVLICNLSFIIASDTSTICAMTIVDTNAKGDKARLPRDERRAILLTAALEVFTAAGYHSAAMDEIADRASVSKPVLYQHFPSKLDLYLAVLDLHIDSLVFELQKAISSTPDNSKRVHATVVAYFEFIENEGEAFRLLFESDMSVEPQVRERLNRMTYDCAAAVSAIISNDTGLPQEVAMLLGVGLIGYTQVTARHWLDRDSKLTRQQAVELVENLMWRGISGFPLSDSE
jgi:AcrR family transcriptional regulator